MATLVWAGLVLPGTYTSTVNMAIKITARDVKNELQTLLRELGNTKDSYVPLQAFLNVRENLPVGTCETFKTAAIPTADEGLVLGLDDGSAFTITIKQIVQGFGK